MTGEGWPFSLRIGSTGFGVGVGCGIGVGAGRPINLGEPQEGGKHFPCGPSVESRSAPSLQPVASHVPCFLSVDTN